MAGKMPNFHTVLYFLTTFDSTSKCSQKWACNLLNLRIFHTLKAKYGWFWNEWFSSWIRHCHWDLVGHHCWSWKVLVNYYLPKPWPILETVSSRNGCCLGPISGQNWLVFKVSNFRLIRRSNSFKRDPKIKKTFQNSP